MGLFLEKVVIILVCIFCSDVTVTPYWLLILKISTCKTKLTNWNWKQLPVIEMQQAFPQTEYFDFCFEH